MIDSTHHADNDIWGKEFRKKDNIVTRKIAGELFLVPIRGTLADMQRIFTLNPVGEYVWQELDKQKNLIDICDGIVSAFDVQKAQAESDLCEFITDLLDGGLLIG